jgi:Cu(I)/Ag(I) efflux system membrane fusion protein
MNPVPNAARDLESAARVSTSSPHFAAIADGATKLAAAADIKAARAAFGVVSQHVVALLASDKSLASGQHVFECPMVSGYNKWVQPTETLENPYMGKRMLTCGGASSWE